MVLLTTDSAFPAPERGISGDSGLRLLRSRGRVRGAVALLGPAFVAAVALTTAVTAGICAVIIGLNGYLIYVTFGAPAS